MGKEVKIGVAVGVCFILLAGIWFLGTHNSRPPEENPGEAAAPADPAAAKDPAPAPGAPRDPLARDNGRRMPDPLIRNPDSRTAFTFPPVGGPGAGTDLIPPPDAPLPPVGRDDTSSRPPLGRTAEPAPVAPGGRKTHTVKPGESFWTIAHQHLGSGAKHRLIEAANPNINPSALRAGMTVVIPEVAAAKPDTGRVTGQPAPGGSPAAPSSDDYVVKEGDRFDSIVRTKYGDLSRRAEILALNQKQLNGNPNLLRPKMVLKLPAADKLKPAVKPEAAARSGAPAGKPTTPPRTGDTGIVNQPGRFLGID